jgi:ubiquinone/menaquinone biosynthesis C-methylase UbiE
MLWGMTRTTEGRSRRDFDVERFSRWAPRYDRSFLQSRFFRPLHDELATVLSPTGGVRMLDVGCGTGNLALRLAGSGAMVVGVDPAEGMVAAARAKRDGLPASFAVAVAERLPFPDHSFDRTASSVSAHHWEDPEAGFQELARVLRPGGTLAFADVRMPGRVARFLLRQYGRSLSNPHGHRPGWEPEELARLLYGAGFRRVRILTGPGLIRRVVILAAET